MTHQLDTSGAVFLPGYHVAHTWPDLDPFTQGALTAAFDEWAESLNEQGQVLLSWRRGVDRVGFSDLAPETLARFIEDCAAMQAAIRPGSTVLSPDDGAKLWRLRQSGQLPQFPPLTLYLADDGLIRIREGA